MGAHFMFRGLLRARCTDKDKTGFPSSRQNATQKHPSHWTNILGRMTLTCRTPSDTKAPLALGKSAREKTSLGSWEIPLRSAPQYTPRIEKTCSGVWKNTSGTPVRTETDGVCCMQWRNPSTLDRRRWSSLSSICS